MNMNIPNRTLFFGDNLEILRQIIPDETFDLIYLDPPFNSKRPYNLIFREDLRESESQIQAFEDTWHWTLETQRAFEELVIRSNERVSTLMQALERFVGHNDVLAYLTMMTTRLLELHRVLKPTGSLYLHCDPTASHYLKVVLDAIFDKRNFKNEIVWFFKTGGVSKRWWSRKHQTIFFYTKSNNYYFKPIKVKSYLTHKYGFSNITIKEDEKGYYREVYERDVWDIPALRGNQSEWLGYETQKPEELLERIIIASSKEGDWVLDPFCGCGTTVAVAERLKRNWGGIDITILAINLVKKRLELQFPKRNLQINIDGIPTDLTSAKALFRRDPFQFQYWALGLVDAMPRNKNNGKGADWGIDGIMVFKDAEGKKEFYRKGIVQVKGGKVQRSHIATLRGDMNREKAEFGVFITLEEPTRAMSQEAATAGEFEVMYNPKRYPRMQIITIRELLQGKPLNLPEGLVVTPYKQAVQTKMAEKLPLFPA